MKKLLPAALILLFVASAASLNVSSSELQTLKENYNNQSSEIPSFVGNIVGGERINLNLETNKTNETIGVSFEGVNISNVSKEGLENPTMKVWTDDETVSTILTSSDKYGTLEEKLNKNEIKYESTTVEAGIKLTIMSTLQDLASFIGLEF